MIPVFALVGRPNVGKSTLFNRLTKTRDALVANLPGLTRDRQYGEAQLGSRHFIVIDTAGITGEEEGIDTVVAQQSRQAVDEADAVFFMLDAKAGLTASDEQLALQLRAKNKPLFFIANKIDGLSEDLALGFQHGGRTGVDRQITQIPAPGDAYAPEIPLQWPGEDRPGVIERDR